MLKWRKLLACVWLVFYERFSTNVFKRNGKLEAYPTMRFTETNIQDTWLIEPERHSDERGHFARTWCVSEFKERDLNSQLVQCNVSFNKRAGTLRGMHFQSAPAEEAKLVRCTRGRIYDVVADIRPDSPTYLQWQAFDLSAKNQAALYIPEGCAHGFQALLDDTEVFYQMSEFFDAESANGFHHADRQIGIGWPMTISMISEKDQQLPQFSELSLKQPLADVA
jgi:dTDP-4-dehydrorhamnose 3,5-epimerase